MPHPPPPTPNASTSSEFSKNSDTLAFKSLKKCIMEQKAKDQDVLLVKEKNESKLKAVIGFDNDGKLKTEPPKTWLSQQFEIFLIASLD